jgi:hypothetical protein
LVTPAALEFILLDGVLGKGGCSQQALERHGVVTAAKRLISRSAAPDRGQYRQATDVVALRLRGLLLSRGSGYCRLHTSQSGFQRLFLGVIKGGL